MLVPPREVELVGADAEIRRRALQIAGELSLPKATRSSAANSAKGSFVSRSYRGASDEIDVEATLESLVEHPRPRAEHIKVRERVHDPRSAVLLIDVSGSMRGERVRTAAAAVGALAGELHADNLGVVAFWSDAIVLNALGSCVNPQRLLDDLIRLEARGLTNVAFPLQVARDQLARVPARDRRAVLLSDCVHNAGPDPRIEATRLPRLDVLLDASGEHDLELAQSLARVGQGRLAVANSHREIALAVRQLWSQ